MRTWLAILPLILSGCGGLLVEDDLVTVASTSPTSWYDAASLVSAPSITVWSANGFGSALAAAGLPVADLGGPNSQAEVGLEGTQSFQGSPEYPGSAGSLTVYVMAKIACSSPCSIFTVTDSSGVFDSNTDYVTLAVQGSNFHAALQADSSSVTKSLDSTQDDHFHLFAIEWSVEQSKFDFTVDDTTQHTDSGTAGAHLSNSLMIGNGPFGTAALSKVSEVIFWNRPLSALENSAVRKYFRTRYGL